MSKAVIDGDRFQQRWGWSENKLCYTECAAKTYFSITSILGGDLGGARANPMIKFTTGLSGRIRRSFALPRIVICDFQFHHHAQAYYMH